jgi:transmembrane sensor
MHDELSEWEKSEEVDLPPKTWNDVWLAIERKRKMSGKIVWIKRATAAALIVGAGIIVLQFYRPQRQIAPAPVVAEAVTNEQRVLVNTTTKMLTAYLPDSSVAILSPGAVIKCTLPFRDNRRQFYLTGKARFNVRKDKLNAFTVYAGGLATTALGTEFTVSASNSQSASVELHSGKVVVKATGSYAARWERDIYLNPGEQLTFDASGVVASVGPIKDENTTKAKKVAARHTKPAKSQDMVFVNEELWRLLLKLEKKYNAKILFNAADIANMNFTGTISETDSLPVVLKVIAQMNGLELVAGDGRFELTKLP